MKILEIEKAKENSDLLSEGLSQEHLDNLNMELIK